MSDDTATYLYEVLSGMIITELHPWDSLSPEQQAAWLPVADAFRAAQRQMPAWQEWSDEKMRFEIVAADGRRWTEDDGLDNTTFEDYKRQVAADTARMLSG